MTTYILVKQDGCSNCAGTGVIPNPEWTEANIAWDNHPQGRIPTTAYEILQAWKRVENYWFLKTSSTDRADWPPEEINCPKCNATGIVRNTFPITQSEAKELFDVLRKYIL